MNVTFLVNSYSVVGVPDERLGEVGAAFIVATPDGPPDLSELGEWCRREMANYKVPRYFWLIDELPLNPSNKVLKTELRARAAGLLA